jgi:DME family drug/metabolite transporter
MIEPSPRRTGRLLIVVAALLWSSGGFFAKAPLFEGWPGPVLAFWRAAWASVILLPMVRRWQWSWKLIPMIATFAAMNWTYLSAMTRGEAANAIWLQSTAPVWVFLVNAVWLRERIQARDWLLLLFGGAGVALILACEIRGDHREAVYYGLLSGLFYAGVVLSLRQLRDFDASWLVALNHLGAALFFSPFVATHPEYWPQGKQWFLLAGFGILQMGLPYVCFARGLKSVPSHEASGIGLLEPVLLPLWVYVAWHNASNYTPPRWWTLAGAGLILIGLLVRYADGFFKRQLA